MRYFPVSIVLLLIILLCALLECNSFIDSLLAKQEARKRHEERQRYIDEKIDRFQAAERNIEANTNAIRSEESARIQADNDIKETNKILTDSLNAAMIRIANLETQRQHLDGKVARDAGKEL
jgi:uncharacterized protein YydD (DUF2326 family)